VSIVSTTKSQVTVVIDEEMCKGCGLCVSVCPRRAMEAAGHTNSRGFHPAGLTRPEDCTGCAACALMCPDVCIKITRSS
jgi:2-oxoglutarate ferredoxin oxidoreductase subunit delta